MSRFQRNGTCSSQPHPPPIREGVRRDTMLSRRREASSMQLMKGSIWLAAIGASLAGSCHVDAVEPAGPQLTPLVADVLAPPHAVLGSDRRTHLVYEIRIANVTKSRIALRR